MARPLRIEFPGAVYHVTSRGDRREAVFSDDDDRHRFLRVLGQALGRFDAAAFAHCLMGNHYHLVLQTRQANLSRLMRHVNGVYTQAFNHHHGTVGHLLQGRYKAILIDRDAYLVQVCRYVELNPVRAGLVAAPGDWPWSSYRAHIGAAPPPAWLATAELQAQLLGHEPQSDADRRSAQMRYHALVEDGDDRPLWPEGLRQQIYLGSDDFVARMQATAAPARSPMRDVPRAQRAAPMTLDDWLEKCPTREEALLRAHTESGISMTALAEQLGLSVSWVSRLIANGEKGAKGKT